MYTIKNLLSTVSRRRKLTFLIGVQLLVAAYLVFCTDILIFDADHPLPWSSADYKDVMPLGDHAYQTELSDVKFAQSETVVNSLEVFNKQDHRKLSYPSHSIVYDYMLMEHNVTSLVNLPMQDRCDLYFTTLFFLDPTWSLDPNENFDLEGRFKLDYNQFEKENYDQCKAELKEMLLGNVTPTDEYVKKRVREKFDEFWTRNLRLEQRTINNLSHMKIYNKCYVSATDPSTASSNKLFVRKQIRTTVGKTRFKQSPKENLVKPGTFKKCSNTEKRVYPWLSMEYPIYERWTGQIYMSPPIMSKYISKKDAVPLTNPRLSRKKGQSRVKSRITNDNAGCFLADFKNSLNGKGIALSIGDQHVDEAVKLIHLLRALQNTLPIQFIFKDSLTTENKNKLIKAAREKFQVLPISYKTVFENKKEEFFSKLGSEGLPKQEIWFVNTRHAIDKLYYNKFEAYSNKLMATLFNSFEEFILIDVDTVLLKNPKYFLELPKYIETGAYFYKDRAIQQFSPKSDSTFFKKIATNPMDAFMFNFDLLDLQIWEFDYFKHGRYHYMESGLVVIDRLRHFNSVLTMIQMNFYNLVKDRVWGDKELFWLSFLVNGESFAFNPWDSATIGVPTEERKNTHFSKEMCSSHPGHVDENATTLEWFNSGFNFCGRVDKVNFEEEFQHILDRYKDISTVKELKDFYSNKLVIKNAIIPPLATFSHTNVHDEPEWGWMLDNRYCKNYLWCGYDRVGGTQTDGKSSLKKGKFITFDDGDVDVFAYLGDIWLGINQE